MNKKITLKGNVKILDDGIEKYVYKKKTNNIKNTYDYLLSRSFDYYPKYTEDKNYDIYEYIEDIKQPKEQKIEELIILISLLHSKTTYYKEIDIDDFKYLYESINDKLEDVTKFYDNLIYNINNEIYMSPSSYLLARNIYIIYSSINYCKYNIDKWYQLIKDKRKVRYVTNHNNASLEHFIKRDKPYLISWDKSKIDLPILDLIRVYKKHYYDFDFNYIFRLYESKYPLLEEERLLLLIYISIPDIINVKSDEYNLCIRYRYLIDYLYKTKKLTTEYGIKDKTHK